MLVLVSDLLGEEDSLKKYWFNDWIAFKCPLVAKGSLRKGPVTAAVIHLKLAYGRLHEFRLLQWVVGWKKINSVVGVHWIHMRRYRILIVLLALRFPFYSLQSSDGQGNDRTLYGGRQCTEESSGRQWP